MQRGVLVFMLFTLCSIGLFGLFGGCKIVKDNASKVPEEQQKKEEQIIKELHEPTSDIPAHEGFKNVRYESVVQNKDKEPLMYLTFGDKSIVAIGHLGPTFMDMIADYVVDGNAILFDFSKRLTIRKNITLEQAKQAYIVDIQHAKLGKGKNETDEEYQERVKKDEEYKKRVIEEIRAGKHDELLKKYVSNIHQQAEELEKITPIKATVSADKSKIVLEKYVFIDINTGERSEHKDIEFVKR